MADTNIMSFAAYGFYASQRCLSTPALMLVGTPIHNMWIILYFFPLLTFKAVSTLKSYHSTSLFPSKV